jgi:hypothetical protein
MEKAQPMEAQGADRDAGGERHVLLPTNHYHRATDGSSTRFAQADDSLLNIAD